MEAIWWRLLNHQQTLDYRGSVEQLRTPKNADRVRRFLEGRIRQGRLAVAKISDEIVGICTFSPDGFLLDAPNAVWEISDVWVEPHARRKGIATSLINYAEYECKMRGSSQVRLSVYNLNEAAISLYESLGFTISAHTFSRHLGP